MVVLKRVRGFLGLKENIVILGATGFLLDFFPDVWVPFLPIYLACQGVGVSYIATLYTVMLITSTLASIPGGILADKFGRKRLIVISGLLIFIFYLFLGLSTIWVITAISLVMFYCSSSLSQPAVVAMIGETSKEEDMGIALGSYHFLISLGSVLAPIIGGILLEYGIFQLIFLISAFSALISTLIRLHFLKETRKSAVKDQKALSKSRASSTHYSFNKNVLLFMMACIAFAFAGGLVFPFTSLFSEYVFNFSATELGIMFSGGELVALLANIPVGKISDKIKKKRSLIIGWLGTSLLTAFWAHSPNFYIAVGIFSLSSVFFQLNIIAYEAFLISITTEKTRGSWLGIFSTATGLAMSSGPIIGGYLWVISPFLPFWFCGVIGGTATCIVLLVRHSAEYELLKV